jgi:hypothetical protein
MNTTTDTGSKKLGAFPFVIGGMSFIPVIGLIFGFIAIIWGLVTNKRGGKRLACIGAGGISFTFVLYGTLFYFGTQPGGAYEKLRVRLAQTSINSLVPLIEFYKIQNGRYPESLKVLQEALPKESFVLVFDPTIIEVGEKQRYFYYEPVGDDHYYLRGLGPDGKPFTGDDIVPHVSSAPSSKIGLLFERKAD